MGAPTAGGAASGHAGVTRRRAAGGLAGAAAMIAGVTVVSRLLGFLRWLVQEATVGHGLVSGAYNAANTLPNVLFEVAAGGALAGAVVPLLAGPLGRGLHGEVDAIASALLGWAMAVLVPLAVLLGVCAEPLAALLVDQPGAARDLVARFVVVFAVQVPLYGIGVVLSGVLQSQKAFFWPAVSPVLSTLVVIGAYAAYGLTSAAAPGEPVGDVAFAWLAWGTTAGVVALSLPQLVPVLRSGVRLRPTLRFPAGVARRAWSLASAGVGALLAQQVAVLVVLWLALHYGTVGTNTVFLYTQAVYLLPYAVLAVPLTTSTFPRVAARAAAGDLPGLRRLTSATTRAVLVVAGLGTAVLVAVAPAVAQLFAAIGAGDASMSAMAPALTWMAPGVVGLALVFHVSRVLYALEQGRAAVIATAMGWSVVAVVAVLLTVATVPDRPDGARTLQALATATSVGMLVGGAGLLLALHRVAGPGGLDGVGRTMVVLVGAAGVAGAVGRWTTDAVLTLLGAGLAPAIGAGAGGGLLAAVVVAVAVLVLDRSTVSRLRSLDVLATTGRSDP